MGLIRIWNYSLTSEHHEGFASAILYWLKCLLSLKSLL
ncbi:cytochrome c oxidase subunit 3 (mitochondrion) [Neolecta irregularis DAH-3]|uniref:Cytochrome c oxidase subunit 3 n=1 Tax=Neolecta irregularis (strain DAH-3) TaxID=1198029 RepID=A0A1U7LG34_NEOID|nr:cytochrome c oxidase subunit 3 [Neolecta irregularis DAH-3]|eukprot:OLL21615.1 cytochrome c oxidase subunit 3 (mitochondrion) [Neolecta irregularis DAH-3]